MDSKLRTMTWILAATIVAAPLIVAAAPQCGTFELVPTPNPGGASNALVDIAAVGDGTAWAIGSQSGAATTGLILHFDGTDWVEAPMPAEAAGVALGAIGNTPDGDVWMVGTRSYTVYEVEVFYFRARNGVVDRVDSFPVGGGPLHISGTSASDVWGVSGGIWPSDQGGYVQHFDGSDWTNTQLPAPFIYRNDPKAIYAAGPDDVWIVGVGGDSRARYEGYVQHWDGLSWQTVPTPFDGQNLTYFLSVDGSSSNDIWVTGHVNHAQEILMHWDGSGWTQHSGPAPAEPRAHAVVPSLGNAWSAPYSLAPGTPFLYWDGTDWTDGGVPDVPGAVTVNWRGISSGGACDVWAVGSYHDGSTHHTLVARLVDGTSTTTGIDAAPTALTLRGNHPNPFNPSTVISFELAASDHVELRVFSSRGRLIRTLLSGTRGPGVHDVTWNGLDDAGQPVASGAYLYQVRHSGGTSTGKMAVTK